VIDKNKQMIIDRFNQNVKDKIADTTNSNQRHDGKKGHWLEQQMGIKANASNSPDIYGYEMKNQTSSGKITFGDWSADEYIFQHGRPTKKHATNQNYNISKNRFLEIFGKANQKKNNRLSWSGTPCPSYLNGYSPYGQVLKIDHNSDIVICYSYSKDQRVDKTQTIPIEMQKEDLVLAKWYRESIKKKLEDKFNQQGWFTCKMNRQGVYDSIHFGKPMNFESWIELLEKGIVFFDSGMYYGNSRNYSQWRAYSTFWDTLITESY
jgi:hypothetical protein